MRLTARDKQVIDAFTDKASDASKKLSSDGRTLFQHGGGSSGPVAEWRGDKIYFLSTGGASNDVVHRAIGKMTPAFWLAGWAKNPSRGLTASRDDGRCVTYSTPTDRPCTCFDCADLLPESVMKERLAKKRAAKNPSYSKNRDDYPTDRELAIAIAYMDREFVDLDKNPITWDMWAEGLAFGGGKGFSKPEPWMVDAAKQMRSQLTKADWERIGALAYSLGARQGVYEWIMRGGKEY